MSKTVEFYFDFGSPTAYLAHKRLQQLQAQYGFVIDYRPVLLGGVFKATGNMSPVAIPAKGKYMLEHDLPRFAGLYGVPLNFNPFFPINTLNLMRGAVAALQEGFFEPYIDALFDAVWVDGKDLGDLEVVKSVLESAGIDVDKVMTSIQDPAIKSALIANTEEAVERGVFGVPTVFLGSEMYFGQDRLQFVEQAMQDQANG
jgi:2-hydroxychromene-2-carboxylate isomerase